MRTATYRNSLENGYYTTYSAKRRNTHTKTNTFHILPVEFRISLFLVLFFMIMVLFGNFYSIGAHSSTTEAPLEKYYTCIEVVSGDTLIEIALEHQSEGYSKASDLMDEICYINHIDDTDTIYIGQTLIIPYYR